MPRRGKMTAAHKDAIRKGRSEAQAVKAYLESLGGERRRRSSDPATLKKRLAAAEAQLKDETNVLKILELKEEARTLRRQLEAAGSPRQASDLEKDFVKSARAFATRKGISYDTFRDMGVSPKVLAAAGITRSGR